MAKEPKTALARYCAKKKISQLKLREMVNKAFPETAISPATVSRIMSGKQDNYQIDTLKKFCTVLKTKSKNILDF